VVDAGSVAVRDSGTSLAGADSDTDMIESNKGVFKIKKKITK